MIRSMTGYGRAECILYNRKFSVEIKSVNHRYNDMTIKLPRTLNAYEDRLRKKLGAQIFRGKTDVYVNMETFSRDDINIVLNETLTDAYVDVLSKIRDRYGLTDSLDLSVIARLPDIMTVNRNIDEEKSAEEIWEALDTAASSALERFMAMRDTEGEALKRDIADRLGQIKLCMARVAERAPLVAAEYSEKLRARITEYLADAAPDEARLLTEVALFADRCCIDEELIRMDSHMAQFDEILGQSEPVGRKLDFLVQEMNREVNTIGSKSNDIHITKVVVDLKSQVEKIREQIQNIE